MVSNSLSGTALFGTVLVANRGEIACRIIRTLRQLGIRSVAVYSDADRDAKHVALADVAVRLGPAAPAHSYLDVEAVIAAAKLSGADAIHPGYGFLSENSGFARACAEAGIVFIGPGIDALQIMGDKIRAKNHVAKRGVPVIAGLDERSLDDAQLIAAAPRIGFPLLIKPSAGGGGKGMTVVEKPEELPDALAAARRIATAAFGDDTLFLERLVPQPRHIEVQVLADQHGNIIHLGERECSLQRRHQKIIEEAPSALFDDATRERIGDAACEVAQSVGYVGAGTVEFLVSATDPGEFFFMEMNTRLQVEHPVTELVTGIDIVEWQVRIAAGSELRIRQPDVVLTGHAIEARIYAEDPSRGFLPDTGTVIVLEEPDGDGVRVDSSLVEGLVVPSNYDPLLSKVIAWGADRAQALLRLDAALADTTVLGLHTNIEFLRALLADDDVRAGRLDTGLIERMLGGIRFGTADDSFLAAAALFLHSLPGAGGDRMSSGPAPVDRERIRSGPWRQRSGWRVGAHRPARYSFAITGSEPVDVLVTGSPDSATVAIGGVEKSARFVRTGNTATIQLGQITRELHIGGHGAGIWLSSRGFVCELGVRDRATQLAEHRATLTRVEGAASPEVRSAMPGTVVSVNASTGDEVEIGQTILVVEAMKMEHALVASVAGTLTIAVRKGDQVRLDQVVASIDPHASINPHEGARHEL